MKQLYAFALILLLAGCKKSAKDDTQIIVCPEAGFSWLSAKAEEFKSCTCKISFIYGVYNNMPVVEIRGVDPACQSINTVYKQDGAVLFDSSNPEVYQKYLDEVTNTNIVWTCEKPGKS